MKHTHTHTQPPTPSAEKKIAGTGSIIAVSPVMLHLSTDSSSFLFQYIIFRHETFRFLCPICDAPQVRALAFSHGESIRGKMRLLLREDEVRKRAAAACKTREWAGPKWFKMRRSRQRRGLWICNPLSVGTAGEVSERFVALQNETIRRERLVMFWGVHSRKFANLHQFRANFRPF